MLIVKSVIVGRCRDG